MFEILEYIQITLNDKRRFYVYNMYYDDFIKLLNSKKQFIELIVDEIYDSENFYREDYIVNGDTSGYSPNYQELIINKNIISKIYKGW